MEIFFIQTVQRLKQRYHTIYQDNGNVYPVNSWKHFKESLIQEFYQIGNTIILDHWETFCRQFLPKVHSVYNTTSQMIILAKWGSEFCDRCRSKWLGMRNFSRSIWAKTEASCVELPWLKWNTLLCQPVSVLFLLNLYLVFRVSFGWMPLERYSLPSGLSKPSNLDDCGWTYVYNGNVPCPGIFNRKGTVSSLINKDLSA